MLNSITQAFENTKDCEPIQRRVSLRENLEIEKARYTDKLKRIQDGLDILDKHPEVIEIIDILGRIR